MDQPTPSAIRHRWQGAVTGGSTTGFTAIPNILIRSQAQMRLSPTEMVVLLNILLHWWQEDDWPFPRAAAIGARMGKSRRTVERAIRSLQEKGLVVHQKSDGAGDGPAVRRFDLSGLIGALRSRVDAWHGFKSRSDPVENQQ